MSVVARHPRNAGWPFLGHEVWISEVQIRFSEELARKAGVRRETILFIEKGEYNPSLNLAHQIAKSLKTTIDELFIFND